MRNEVKVFPRHAQLKPEPNDFGESRKKSYCSASYLIHDRDLRELMWEILIKFTDLRASFEHSQLTCSLSCFLLFAMLYWNILSFALSGKFHRKRPEWKYDLRHSIIAFASTPVHQKLFLLLSNERAALLKYELKSRVWSTFAAFSKVTHYATRIRTFKEFRSAEEAENLILLSFGL